MSKKVILVWFRNDLRTHDNEILYNATLKADFVIPVYIFDPRYYETNKSGFNNTGEFRKEYIFQSVKFLKEKLQSLGGDLLTYEGYPEEIIPQLVQKYDADEVFHHREVAQRETHISEQVEEALWKIKRNLRHFIGHTLYHKEDLPFPIKDIPTDFNIFKKKIEKESNVRQPLPEVTSILIPPHLEKTVLPQHPSLNLNIGIGEDTAFEELRAIIATTSVKEDLYTSLSHYLAVGSLSPISTYHLLIQHINTGNKKNITQIIAGLLERDYFRFMLKKFPNSFFINKEPTNTNPILLQKWISGTTELEPINKLMHELNNGGYLSHEQKEILGMHLIYEYQQNWLDGAAWFEQQLVDYAPATTYGIWAHLAGQGTNKKSNKTIDDWVKIKQSLD